MKIVFERWNTIVHRNIEKPNFTDDELAVKLLEANSFDQIKEIFESARMGSDLKQMAFERLPYCAVTFEDWHYVHIKSQKGSEFAQYTFSMMKERAKTFSQRVIVYEESEPYEEQLQEALFQDLLNTANSFEQWKTVLYRSNHCKHKVSSEHRQHIVYKMSMFAKTERQWKTVQRISAPGSQIKRLTR